MKREKGEKEAGVREKETDVYAFISRECERAEGDGGRDGEGDREGTRGCELQNYSFAGLISLMRPDHLTGELFFPPFSFGPLAHCIRTRATASVHASNETSRERFLLPSHRLGSYSEICNGRGEEDSSGDQRFADSQDLNQQIRSKLRYDSLF